MLVLCCFFFLMVVLFFFRLCLYLFYIDFNIFLACYHIVIYIFLLALSRSFFPYILSCLLFLYIILAFSLVYFISVLSSLFFLFLSLAFILSHSCTLISSSNLFLPVRRHFSFIFIRSSVFVRYLSFFVCSGLLVHYCLYIMNFLCFFLFRFYIFPCLFTCASFHLFI